MKRIISLILSVTFIIITSVSGFATAFSVEDEAEYSKTMKISETTADASVQIDTIFKTDAKALVLMEKSTGKILYSENEREKLFPASVTKIMSLLLIAEAIDSGKIKLTDTVSCSKTASEKGGSQIWLEPNEQMTVDELLKAVCIYSANDACTLLGEYINGSEEAFVDAMNKKAEQIGMKDTHFDNCTGLDDETDTHLTTAYDVALMSKELLLHDIVKKYTGIWMDSLRDGKTQLVNTNRLVRFYDGITGLKTGTTEKAGCCISASAMRNGMELIAVVLGCSESSERFDTAEQLLNFGFANYEIAMPEFDTSAITAIEVISGKEDSVALAIPDISAQLINKGKAEALTVKLELPENLTAPVEKGKTAGKIIVLLDNEVINEYEIKTAEAIDRLDFFTAFYKLLTSF